MLIGKVAALDEVAKATSKGLAALLKKCLIFLFLIANLQSLNSQMNYRTFLILLPELEMLKL